MHTKYEVKSVRKLDNEFEEIIGARYEVRIVEKYTHETVTVTIGTEALQDYQVGKTVLKFKAK